MLLLFSGAGLGTQKPVNIIISGVLFALEIQPGPHRVIGTADGKLTLMITHLGLVLHGS